MAGQQGEKTVMFGFKCPQSSSCKRGGKWFQGETVEEARNKLVNHLHVSPYHSLSEDEAEVAAVALEPDSWEVDLAEWRQWEEEKANWGSAKRRKGAPKVELAPIPPQSRVERSHQLKDAFSEGSGSSGAASSATAGMRMSTALASQMSPDSIVVLNGTQCQAVLDSLRRARTATQMCAQIAERAVNAFRQEEQCIAECEDVLASWLVRNATS